MQYKIYLCQNGVNLLGEFLNFHEGEDLNAAVRRVLEQKYPVYSVIPVEMEPYTIRVSYKVTELVWKSVDGDELTVQVESDEPILTGEVTATLLKGNLHRQDIEFEKEPHVLN